MPRSASRTRERAYEAPVSECPGETTSTLSPPPDTTVEPYSDTKVDPYQDPSYNQPPAVEETPPRGSEYGKAENKESAPKCGRKGGAAAASRSPEERSVAAKKAAATRKRKVAAKA